MFFFLWTRGTCKTIINTSKIYIRLRFRFRRRQLHAPEPLQYLQ